MKSSNIEFIKEEFRNSNLNSNLINYFEYKELEKLNSIKEVKNYIEEIYKERKDELGEVITFHKAHYILRKYDISLKKSFRFAKEKGYFFDELDVEVLATLVLSEEMYKEFTDILNNVLNELEEEGF